MMTQSVAPETSWTIATVPDPAVSLSAAIQEHPTEAGQTAGASLGQVAALAPRELAALPAEVPASSAGYSGAAAPAMPAAAIAAAGGTTSVPPVAAILAILAGLGLWWGSFKRMRR
jgi:hypothetical protein